MTTWTSEHGQKRSTQDNPEARDKGLANIYKSAKMMKFHPQITKDLKKTYGLLASAALRAMSPEQKWAVKRQMHPYLAAKKQIAEKVKQYKEAAGIVQRDGLRGRIGYWNTLWEANIKDPKIAALITGTVDDVIKQNEKWGYDGIWEPDSYTGYRAKLKDKMKAQREAIARMSPDEYKAYKYQSRALKEARKRVSAQRKATRDAWKANPDLIWDYMSPDNYSVNYDKALSDAIASNAKWKDVDKGAVMASLTNPKTSLWQGYTASIPGLMDRPLPTRKEFPALPLSSRADVNWKSTAAARAADSIGPYYLPRTLPPQPGEEGSAAVPMNVD